MTNALRQRPDRIIVGECRDAAAFDMLQAMTTGHDGSLTTIHADNCREVPTRLRTLVQQANTGMSSREIPVHQPGHRLHHLRSAPTACAA